MVRSLQNIKTSLMAGKTVHRCTLANAISLAAYHHGAAGFHSRQGLCLYLGDGGTEDFDVLAGIQEGEGTA
ncbi:MAG: hypothetical protein ACKPKO_03225, partial [Candidatus Fonsibacter sp.]